MTGTLKHSLTSALVWQGQRTNDNACFKLPEIMQTLAGAIGVAAEFTGTSNHTITFADDSGDIFWYVNSAKQGGPDGVLFIDPKVIGFGIYVGRANPTVAPTGTVTFSTNSQGYGGLTTYGEDVELSDGAFLLFSSGVAAPGLDGDTLNIDLTGTTGYKVSVFSWGAPNS